MKSTGQRVTIWTWINKSSKQRADLAIFEALKNKEGTLAQSSSINHSEKNPDYPACSRSKIQKLLETGKAKVDGKKVKPNFRISPDQKVQIDFEHESSSISPEKIELDILHEDEYLLVVNKPPGLISHPSPALSSGTLVNALLSLVESNVIKSLSSIGGEMRPGIVHRLDKDTSGAMIIAKKDEAHLKLIDQFSGHKIDRRYQALCYGAPPETQFESTSTIGRNPKDRKKMAPNVPGGKSAGTSFICKKKFGSSGKPFASMNEAKLKTGRTHQVRVHLTELGFSVLGDQTYGRPTTKQEKWTSLPDSVRSKVSSLPGQALHAYSITFSHPITGVQIKISAAPPQGFKELLAELEAYTLQI